MYLYVQYITYLRGGFFLSGGCDMGVGVQGKACGEVTEHTADRLDVNAILQSFSKGILPILGAM